MSQMMNAITSAVNTGPVGRDDPAAAFRQDRLIVAELGRMSEGSLLDFIARWGAEPGPWASWVTEQAAARLVREYGYPAEGGDGPEPEDAERFDGLA